MGGLYSFASWTSSAALIGVSLVPLVGFSFWAASLRRRIGEPECQQVRLARISLQVGLPAYSIGVALAIVSPSVQAARSAGGGTSTGLRDHEAAVYIAATSAFLVAVGSLLVTLAVYLCGLGVLYMVLQYQKWWGFLRLDALSGTAILLVLDIIWFARAIVSIRQSDDGWFWVRWLAVIVDLTLCSIAAGVVWVAVYVASKLRKRADLPATGNLSALLLWASFLWLLRCTFVLAVDIKTVVPDWTADELAAQKIIYPILDFWVSSAVVGLVTAIVRRPFWSDPVAIPARGPGHRPRQVSGVEPSGHHPHPQYAQQSQLPEYQECYHNPQQQPATQQQRHH